MLSQQYELSKVIDWAREPIRKFKPKRAQIVVTTFFLSFFFAVLFVLVRDYSRRLKGSSF